MLPLVYDYLQEASDGIEMAVRKCQGLKCVIAKSLTCC